MIFKNFWQNKKFLLAAAGVAVLVAGFWLAQAPKAEAVATEREFIRVKVDSTGGVDGVTQLWNFFATDNGYFDEFSVTGGNYIDTGTSPDTPYPDYTCGLLLTEEFGGAVNDDDYILWAKKGTILGKNNSLFADVTDYKACCTEDNFVSDSCTITTNGNCEAKVYTDANYVFKKTYGTLDSEQCNDDVDKAPCDNTPADCCELSPNYSAASYEFEYQALCGENGKWVLADGEVSCASDGTYQYKFTGLDDGTGTWTKCIGSNPICSDGVCVPSTVEICDNGVDDGDPDTDADCKDVTDCPVNTVCGPDKKCDASQNCVGGGGGGGIVFESPSKFTDLMELVGSIVNSLSYLAIALAVLMLVIAGFIFLTAGGEPQKVNTAKTLVFYTLLGLIIIILAKAIAAAVDLALS